MSKKLCKPYNRFLQAIMRFPDKRIAAFKKDVIARCKNKEKDVTYKSFLNWSRQENEIAVFTTYAYSDLTVPKQFDCIFNYDNPEVYVEAKYTLTHSVWEGWYPISAIESGHKHLCILTFEHQIPDIIKDLHNETNQHSNWTWDAKKVLGLCQLSDIRSIIDRRHLEQELIALHGDQWHLYDEEE